MDIGLKEWLIIGGVLVIGLIIFDGWRRMRGQRDTLRIDIDGKFTDAVDDGHNPELPNGGARLKNHIEQRFEPDSVDLGISARQDNLETYPNDTEGLTDPSAALYEEPIREEADLTDPKRESIRSKIHEPEIQVTDLDTPQDQYEPTVTIQAEEYSAAASAKSNAHIMSEKLEPIEIVEPELHNDPEDYLPEDTQDEARELDPLFDDIPEIISRPRPAKTVQAEPVQQTPTAEKIHQNIKDPIIAAALHPDDYQEELSEIDKFTIEQHDVNAYTSYEVDSSEADGSLEDTSEVVSESEVAKKTDSIDFEQPITVLMRQFTAGREEARIQQEMFDKPEDEVLSAPDSSIAIEPERAKKAVLQASELDVEEERQLHDEPTIASSSVDDLAAAKTQGHKKSSAAKADVDAPAQDSLFEDPLLEGARSERKAREQAPEPDEVLVITVVGKDHPLNGKALLQVVLACGMRHGDMNLFHRFEDGIDQGAVQFSMANAVNPGTFELETMADMETRGVSFFMSMSEPKDPKNAFDCMLATAETVAKHLEGDLLDENHSVMRPQTKMHYRERIREFEMHKRIRRGR